MVEIIALASGSSGNCYRLNDGSTSLLLECGIAFREIQRGISFQVSDLAGCLVSHEHRDHSKAIKDMIKAGVDCYLSKGTSNFLKISDSHRAKTIKANEQFKIGTWIVLPFEAFHDAEEPLGFLLYSEATGAKVLFATDTAYIKNRFSGLTHIMVECNFAIDILEKNVDVGIVPFSLRNRITHSHFELGNVKKFLKANDLSQVEEIWLLHLSSDNSDEERFKKEIQGLTGKLVFVA